MPIRWVDEPAAEVRALHLDLPDLVHRAGQDIAVEDDEVGKFARLERALLLLLEHQVGVIDRVEPDRLLARDALFRVQRLIRPARLARERYPHPEKRIVGIDRPQAADLLHVIRAAADHDTVLEQSLVGLEVSEARVAELLPERGAVEPQ